MPDNGAHLALEKDVVVDVVVTPATAAPDTWILSDRLRRQLGELRQSSSGGFVISPEPESALAGMGLASYASLDDAMSAIATHMKGLCQLSSGDERKR
jgi:hypothetical protein